VRSEGLRIKQVARQITDIANGIGRLRNRLRTAHCAPGSRNVGRQHVYGEAGEAIRLLRLEMLESVIRQ